MGYLSILIFLLAVTASVGQTNDMDWYRSQLNQLIIPPYTRAYSILQNDIIGRLLTINVVEIFDNQTEVSKLADKLSCSTSEVLTLLSAMMNNMNVLLTALDNKLIKIVAAVSAKQAEIEQSEMRRAIAHSSVVEAQNLVRNSENDLQNKQQVLTNVEAELSAANNKLERARRCRTLKIENTTEIINTTEAVDNSDAVDNSEAFNTTEEVNTTEATNTTEAVNGRFFRWIVRSVCSIVNYSGIRSVRNRRNRIRGTVDHARNELGRFRKLLADRRNLEATRMSELTQVQKQRNILQNSFTELQKQQVMTSAMNEQLKKVLGHIGSVFTPFSVFYEVLRSLVNFELLIGPLNDIAARIVNSSIGQIVNVQLRRAQNNMEPDLLEQAGIDRSWESQIVNAPATVNLLGQLMVLSSKRDFSFEAYMPNQTYTFITHRQSFRATLIQIANGVKKCQIDFSFTLRRDAPVPV
ncbi:unnamed protein product [Rotaria magnacalcarata]|uniref:Uncharacterized protein n=2 Tax=Rotaria magnacalcarata TaxID=392030 RepID=A0A819JSK0_9BILA|nr:unnamed protein product [Rotaria magnacalcarata]